MSARIRQSVDAMSGYVPGEQPSDPAIIKLNTNENPYPPAPGVAKALGGIDAASLRRYPDPVCRELCEVIAEQEGCRPEQVIVGNGSDEVLALCTRAFVEDDGSIGWFEPSYSLYPVLTDIRAVASRPVALTDDFRWAMPDGYETDLFFITNPNAPTSLEHPKGLIEAFAADFDGVVVVDEAYGAFGAESCVDLVERFDNVLVARTLSKSHGLAGIRFGYLIGAPDLIGALYKIKDSYNVNGLTQAAAVAALRDTVYTDEVTRRIVATRDRVTAALGEMGCEVADSRTNFLWVRPTTLEAEAYFTGLRERNILIRYFKGERTGDFVRITVGLDDEMDRLLEASRELLT